MTREYLDGVPPEDLFERSSGRLHESSVMPRATLDIPTPETREQESWIDRQARIDQLTRLGRSLLSENKANPLTIDTLARSLNTDELTAEAVVDRFGKQVMQRGKGQETEYILWSALPRRSKAVWALGRSQWTVRETARLEK